MKLACVLVVAVAACHGNDTPRHAPRDASASEPTRDAAAIDTPPPAPHYTIDFPAPSQTRTTSVQTTSGPMPQQVETAELDGTMYMVVSGSLVAGLPDGNKPGGQDRVLAMFGARATRDVAIKLGDIDGREVRFTGAATGILRTYTVNTWMVQAGVVARTGPIDEARAKRFFESLQIHR